MAMNIPAPVQILRYTIDDTDENSQEKFYEFIASLEVGALVLVSFTFTPMRASMRPAFLIIKNYDNNFSTFASVQNFGEDGYTLSGLALNDFREPISVVDVLDHSTTYTERGYASKIGAPGNIDSAVYTGFYGAYGASGTFPTGYTNEDYVVLIVYNDSNEIDNNFTHGVIQIAYCSHGFDSNVEIFIRRSTVQAPYNADSWTDWQPLSSGGLFGKSVALSGSSIDASQGSCFTKTITADTVFTFTGVPSDATARFSLVLTNGGSQTVTWPSSVKWSGGANPELTASGVDVFTFLTVDGGTTWYGAHSVQGAA